MIKVCMIVNKQYHYDPRVRRYADALADAGAQVDVLCLGGLGQRSGKQRTGVRVFTIPIGRTRKGIGHYLLQYGAALFLFSIWLLPLYVKNRYQVIHVHNMPDFLVFAALIPRILGAKVILDIHDPMPDFYATKFRKPQRGSPEVRLMRVQEKVSAAVAQAVITVNLHAKDNLIMRGMSPDKITVIRNLPDLKIFDRDAYQKERQNKHGHFTLVFPGTIAPRYGLEVAIRALPLLVTRVPQLRLAIIGSQSDHVEELAELAEQLGVSSLVHFEPLIPQDEVPQHLAQADVGIYPALPDPYMNMATPTKVLEYAAMGLPIIAARVQALELLFPDSALLFFDAGNEHDFARCVLELYSHPERRDELVRNADSVLARTFCWSGERLTYFGLLNRLLGPRGGNPFRDEIVGGPVKRR